MVGGSGGGFLYSSTEKTCLSGDGSEESDLFSGRFTWGWAEAVGISARVFGGGANGGGTAEGSGDGSGEGQWVGVIGGECGLTGFGGVSAIVSAGWAKKATGDFVDAKAGESLE